MFDPYSAYQYAKDKQAEFIREAEKARLIRSARKQAGPKGARRFLLMILGLLILAAVIAGDKLFAL